MTRNQRQNRRQATPRQTAAQIAIKERRALETLHSLGYVITQHGPYAYFIQRKAG